MRELFITSDYTYKRCWKVSLFNRAKSYPGLFQRGHLLDIGIKISSSASACARFMDKLYKVFAIEPEQRNFEYLTDVLSRYSGMRAAFMPRQSAMGGCSGVIEILRNKGHHARYKIILEALRVSSNSDNEILTGPIARVDSRLRERVPDPPISLV